MRTPLAWRNLTHDPRRLAVIVSAVGFAVVLIFMQLGFMSALLESTVQILHRLNGDWIVVSKAKYALLAAERFDLQRVEHLANRPGVAAIHPIYIETSASVLRQGRGRGFPIRVLAFREGDHALQLDSLALHADALHRPQAVLFDRASRGKYHFPASPAQTLGYAAELAGQRIELVGQFHLGIDFANDGNLIMTAANFARFFPERGLGADPLRRVDLAVIQLDEGAAQSAASRAALLGELNEILSADNLEVVSKHDLIEREMAFWRHNAPVGYMFLVGVYIGFVVGVVICYQVIYSDIADHMKEFATLKAMGYQTRYFMGLALTQSLYLSGLAFAAGAVVSYVLYGAISAFTGLTMQMTWTAALQVLLATLLMCSLSALLAVRKLIAADPAELFT